MSMSNENRRNEARAGIFILLTALLGLAIVVVLVGRNPFRATTAYGMRFTVEEGVSGLDPGSDVRIGGIKRGRVTMVEPVFSEPTAGAPDLKHVVVHFEIDPEIPIYENAIAFRETPLLGGSSWINFVSLGGPERDDLGAPRLPAPALLAEGDHLDARTGGGVLAALVGPQNAQSAGDAIRQIEAFTAFLNRIPDDYDDQVVPMLVNAREIVERIQADWDPWSERIDATLTSASSAAGKLDDALDGAAPLVRETRDTVARIDDVIERNEDQIDRTMVNVAAATDDAREIARRIRAEMLDDVEAILDDAVAALTNLDDGIGDVRTNLDAGFVEVRSTLANLRRASGSLKLAAAEVRRSPWKLLYAPKPEELEHELLYESARAYAEATSDLAAASESLQTVLDRHATVLEARPELRALVESQVVEAMDRFSVAQQQLFSLIVESAERPPAP